MNSTKLNSVELWKQVFLKLFKAFDGKNQQANTVKSMANYGVLSRFHGVPA